MAKKMNCIYSHSLCKKSWGLVIGISMNVYKLLQDTMMLISAFKVEDKDRFVYVTSADELLDEDLLVGVQEKQYDL